MTPIVRLTKQRLNGMDGWEWMILLRGQVHYGWSAGTKREAQQDVDEYLEGVEQRRLAACSTITDS